MRTSTFRANVVIAALGGLLATGCPLFRGAVNASPSLRWFLFSNFGASKMCPEMLKRGAPLTLVPGGDVMGRFFPNQCQADVNDDRETVTLHFAGTGYAWTPIAGRMGFSVSAAIEYRPDFQMESDAVYIWARVNQVVEGPTFAIGSIENPVANWAAKTPAGYLASTFGGQIVASRLSNGFTVIHTDQGDDFSLEILQPPAKPPHPLNLGSDDRILYANETTDINVNEMDFLGPFEVTEGKQALYFKFKLAGPPVDVLVYPRNVGDPWRNGLQQGAPLAPPPIAPLASFVIQPNGEQDQRMALAPGEYYFVVDNSSRVGVVSPPWNPISALGSGAAVLSYSAELGSSD